MRSSCARPGRRIEADAERGQRAVTDYPDVALGQRKPGGDLAALQLLVERQLEDPARTVTEGAETAEESRCVHRVSPRLASRSGHQPLVRGRLGTAVELSHAEHGIAARPEDEARQLLGLTHPLLARGLEHGE